MNTLYLLWHDQRGEVSSMSTILLATLLALGSIVGLATIRDHIVQQLGDVALALENLNQSFSTTSLGSYSDPGPFPTDPAGEEPACLDITVPATGE